MNILLPWYEDLKLFSHVQLFSTPWTAAYQPPPSRGFSRQEYWSGLPFPSPSWPRDGSWVSLVTGRCFTVWATREAFKVGSPGMLLWQQTVNMQMIKRKPGGSSGVLLLPSNFSAIPVSFSPAAWVTLKTDLTHVVVWQKPIQQCEAIVLQLKIN